jgi:hypothetical protein
MSVIWRTKACAGGVNCDETQLTSLCIIQGETLDVSFTAPVLVEGQPIRAEIRTAPYGRLILDMAPYCSADPTMPNMVRITLPAEVTQRVVSDGYYDVWVAHERIARGPAIADLSISLLPPRNVLTGSWTPVITVGQDFVRNISVVGLLPPGEEISLNPGRGPDLNIEDLHGKEVVWFMGSPELTVTPDGQAIDLALSVDDVAKIGPGRFTYKLHAWNTLHELRTLLAGVLLVTEEGSVRRAS